MAAGSVVYAGVDYASILKEAEKEADVVLWDGGNNDLPFYSPVAVGRWWPIRTVPATR